MIGIQKIVGQPRSRGIGMMITDHDVRETLSICDRAHIIEDGEILKLDTPGELAADPRAHEANLGENFTLS